MDFRTPCVLLPQLYVSIVLQYVLWRYYLVLGQWITSGTAGACVCSRSPRAGRNPHRAQLPPYLADNLI